MRSLPGTFPVFSVVGVLPCLVFLGVTVVLGE